MLSGFVDTHCHILSGLDDGAATLDESLAMAKIYAGQGARHLIATPHFISGTAWANSAQRVGQAVRKLQQVLHETGINLTIHPGMEIACSHRISDLFAQGALLPLGGKGKAYLLEPDFHGNQAELAACVQFMLRNALVPIIAHPERIAFFQDNPAELQALIHLGARVQLTIDSLLAPADSRRCRFALSLIQTKQVHYLASDAHASTGRKPPDERVWRRLTALIGEEAVQRLCVDNPSSLLTS